MLTFRPDGGAAVSFSENGTHNVTNRTINRDPELLSMFLGTHCPRSSPKCPFASGQHFQSRPSTRMSREIAENARIFEGVTSHLLFR